jgi:uncharacterized protein (TIGR02001 family)
MLALLALAAPTAWCDTPEALSWTVSPSYVSQYMFRGERLGGPAFQPSLEADFGGWALGVWNSDPLAGRVPGQSNPEIDPYGSYTIKLGENLSLQPGFTWYTYPRAPLDQGYFRSTFEPSLALNWTAAGVTLTPKVYYDVILRGPTGELNGAYAVPLKSIGSELDFAATIGSYVLADSVNRASPRVKSGGNYWLVGVTLPWTLPGRFTIKVGWAYTRGTGAYLESAGSPRTGNALEAGRGVATVTLNVTF